MPTNEDLAELAKKPLPEMNQALDAAAVESWTLQGPFPGTAPARHAAATPWEASLEQMLGQAAAASATEGMHCAAREVGLFFLAHNQLPAQRLREHMAQRCSAYVTVPGFGYLTAEVPEGASDQEIFDRWSEGFGAQLERIRKQSDVLGVWFGKQKGRAVVIIAGAKTFAQIEDVARDPSRAGAFNIRGTITHPVDRARAIIGIGKLGVASCEQDSSVALPRFSFVCTATASDASSAIEIISGRPGQLLDRVAVRLLVSATGDPPALWSAETIAGDRPPASAAELKSTFFDALNRLRVQGGMRPLLLEPAQSELAERVAPHYFAAELGLTDRAYVEMIALGLCAGWSVGGPISSGYFASAGGTLEDAGIMAATVLAYPWSREILLRPDAVRIAIGPALLGNAFGGLVVATYTELPLLSDAELRSAFIARVTKARATYGLGPPRMMEGLEQAAADVRVRIEKDGDDPQDVAGDFMQAALSVQKRHHGFGRFSVEGFVAEGPELSEIPLPEAMLRMPNLDLGVAFAIVRGGRHPWARYVVLIAYEKVVAETASL